MQRITEREAISCGVGANLQEARDDAIRQGIQYLVGSYVTSDLETNNEQISKDSVTDYSGAIADRFEIIRQEVRSDGMFEISAHIWIIQDANRQRERSARPTANAFDGQSLQAEAISRIEQEQATINLWQDLFRGFPGRAFVYVPQSPQINTLQDQAKAVELKFKTTAYWRRDFLTEFYTLLKSTGREAEAMPDLQRQSLICLQSGFTRHKDADCYVIDVPNKLLQAMLCMNPNHGRTELRVAFLMIGQNAMNIEARNVSGSDVGYAHSNYIGYYWGGFDFYIPDNDRLKTDSEYQSLITDEWSATVAIEDLATTKNINAVVSGCYHQSEG
jgi:hypothetical protein